ncbi:glycosyltransferase family 2 protein [Acinetobacter baumannii]|uniref:Glycosyltransferase family 2 protein n=1 Tax=Acinetobacter baumannii TaxID=470 RepID=A0A3F3MMA3_ACIBA|nr:glycosyltransferase [Acinetobacter baumannii]PZM07255.1 glycosyltransferase family 2 protein [Acinetobacter baumannii]
MSSLPLITVLIPVYNVEAYVEEAINSICNQSYKNLEIIIVDDCSTDNTFSICQKLKKQYKRIKLFRNSKNLKIVKTLNFALSKANGDYIARMDGDDISYPDSLKNKLEFLLENQNFSLVGSHVKTIDENGNIIGSSRFPIEWENILKVFKYSSPVLHIWLAKKEVYTVLKGYREVPGVEDYDFLLRMISSGFYFTNIDKFDYAVRIRSGNTNSTMGFNQRIMSNYVLGLYNSRCKLGFDEFSETNVKNYLEEFKDHKINYEISNIYLNKSIDYRSKRKYFMMFIFLFLAMSKSKFQIDYILKRTFLKIISR